jgi:hypothetical protein
VYIIYTYERENIVLIELVGLSEGIMERQREREY